MGEFGRGRRRSRAVRVLVPVFVVTLVAAAFVRQVVDVARPRVARADSGVPVWELDTISAPGNVNYMNAVSCVDSDCFGAGQSGSGGLVAHESNGAWTTSVTGGSNTQFKGISCASTTMCVAVGDVFDDSGSTSYIASWDGNSWSSVSAPADGGDSELTAVSCPSTTMCVAVGDAGGSDTSNAHPLIDVLQNGSWSTATAAPITSSGGFTGVSCSGTSDCVAVGDQTSGPFAQVGVNNTWTNSALPAGSNDYISSVSCATPLACAAVGSTSIGPGSATYSSSNLVLMLAQGTWTSASAPNTVAPNGGNLNGLASVSCTPTSCSAVGMYSNYAYPNHGSDTPAALGFTLGSSWPDGNWAVRTPQAPFQSDPLNTSTGSGLLGVSCTTPTVCESVGDQVTDDAYNPIAEELGCCDLQIVAYVQYDPEYKITHRDPGGPAWAYGHAWIEFRQPDKTVDYGKYPGTTNGVYTGNLYTGGSAVFRDDGNLVWTHRVVFTVTQDQFNAAMQYALTQVHQANDLHQGNFAGLEFNCMNFVANVVAHANLTLPGPPGEHNAIGTSDPATFDAAIEAAVMQYGNDAPIPSGGVVSRGTGQPAHDPNGSGGAATGASASASATVDPSDDTSDGAPAADNSSATGMLGEALVDPVGTADDFGFRLDTASLDDASIGAGGTVTLDEDGAVPSGALYGVDWGDGSDPSMASTDGTDVPDLTHTFATDGDYAARLVVLQHGALEEFDGTVHVASGGASSQSTDFVVPDAPIDYAPPDVTPLADQDVALFGAPPAPTSVRVHAGNGSATVVWRQPPVDASDPVTAYVVTLSPGGQTETADANVSALVVSGLTNGAPSIVDVAAANDIGTGRSSTSAVVPTSTPTTAAVPLPPASVGQAYGTTVAGAGGTLPYHWSVAGKLPTGLALDASSGAVTGTPSAPGTFAFTIKRTDSAKPAQTISTPFSIDVAPSSIAITPASLSNAAYVQTYSVHFGSSGGTAPYKYSIVAGALPPGLKLAASGVVTGKPTAAGDFAFTIKSTDKRGFTGSADESLSVASGVVVIAPSSAPAASYGQKYSLKLVGSGGATPYKFVVSSGALPPGLKLARSGQISGTPTHNGDYPLTVTATDKYGTVGTLDDTISVSAPSIAISPSALPPATIGTSFSTRLAASGGIAPYHYALTAGVLPPGIVLSLSGVFGGKPTHAGAYSIAVTVTDKYGFTGSVGYVLSVS